MPEKTERLDKTARLEKSLPHSEDAEVAVLGAMLLDKEAVPRVIEIIDDGCFYKESHRQIYRAIVTLFEQNEPPTALLVTEELRRLGLLEGVGGAYYLSTVLDSVATSADVERYAKVLLERAVQRRLIQAATEIATRGYEGREDIADQLDLAEQKIFEISESRLRQSFVPVRSVLRESYDLIQEIHDRGSSLMGLPTGFTDLDAKTSGLQSGDLIIVAGRPSMGKTSFALNIAEYVAVEKNVPVGVFSLEMSKLQLVLRLLCSQGQVDAHRMRTGRLGTHDFAALGHAASTLDKAPIYVDDSPTLSILELRAKARRLHSEVNLGLVVVDYLQLLHGTGRQENRQQEIAMISRSLKALAKELRVPVMALSQLRRPAPVEKRSKDERPQLSDLRESGALEQDADVVLFVYRRWSNDPAVKVDDTAAEIIIGKQRNGPVGTVPLTFLREYTCFKNYSQRVAIPAVGAEEVA